MYSLFFLLPPSALAYEFLVPVDPPYWKSFSTTFTIRTISFPAGSSHHDAVVRAVEDWDQDTIPGSTFGTDWGDSLFTDDIHFNDGVNDVALTQLGQTGRCEPGLTLFRGRAEPKGRYIQEVEVLVDVDCHWSGTLDWYDIFDDNFTEDRFNLEQALLHEFGHGAGLDHEHGIYETDRHAADGPGQNDWSAEQVNSYKGWPNTMEESLGGGSVIGDPGFLRRQYMVNEDDREGLRQLYPSSSNDGLDLAIQSYHTPDADTVASAGQRTCWSKIGERSRPDPYTDFLAQAVAEGQPYGNCPQEMHAPLPVSPFPIFQGASVDVTFSLLNLGNLDSTADWEILISPSDIDYSHARVLLRQTATINVNRPFEVTSTVQIPLDMPGGGYWIVARMDPDGNLAEWDEGNNVAIWNQYVEVVPLSACGCSTGARAPGLALTGLSGLMLLRRRRI